MNKKNLIPEAVPVKKELNHQELYDSPYIRVYMVTLKAGQETQYHSHHEDTIYVVIKGGKIQTINHPLDEGCPNVLLKQYGLIYKIRLLFAKLRKKPLFLVDGLTFFMPSRTKTVVHKAIASIENTHEMILLGIEIKSFNPNE